MTSTPVAPVDTAIRIDPADPVVALGQGPVIAYDDRPVHELIEAQVRAGPDRAAVECAGTTLCYGELWAAAGAVRDALARAGVREGGLVGVALARTHALLPALLGTWRAGCGYVPLDDRMPARRLDRILTEVGAHGMDWVLVDHPDKAAALGVTPVRELDVEGRPILVCRHDVDAAPQAGPELADAAYVIYTSGSTGQPKGAVLTHRNLCAFLTAMDTALGADADELALATTPLTFDLSIPELFWPLSGGRRLVLLETKGDIEPEVLGAVLRRPEPKLVIGTPSIVSLMDIPPDADGVRILVAGEPLPRQTAARLRDRCDTLVSLYGPTETTVYVTFHPVHDLGDDAIISLGRPFANSGLVVLDAEHRPAPVGVEGEIYVYGPQVAAGYLSADATRGAFFPDSSGTRQVYRTGDRAAWSPDGTLRSLGRVDNQVKIAGNRVELGEIEAALRAHADVHDAAVLLDRDPSPPRVLAFVTSATPELPGIWEHLTQYLPAHMIPASLRLLSRLPLTVNGKVDRAALAANPGLEIPRPRADRHEGPAGTHTGVLAALIELAGGLHGPDDDLVQAGVSSLDALRLAGAAWRRFGWNVTGGQVLRLRTLRAIAEHVSGEDHGGRDDEPAPDVALSLAQRAMLAVSYLDPGNPKTNVVLRWQLAGDVDEMRLRAALRTVVDNHPVLRTLYPLTADPVVLDAGREPNLVVTPGTSTPERFLRRPFDLERVPPVRWLLDGPCLYAVLHHVAVDDAALTTLHDALVGAYAGSLPTAARYSAVCAAERRLFERRSRDDRGYWRDRRGSFAGAVGFGAGHERLTAAKACRQAELVPGGAAVLHRVARSMGVTAYSLFLAATSSTVAHDLGGRSVLVGVPVSSREAVGGDGVLGCFANLIPLVVRDHGDDFERTVRECHASVLSGLDHGLLPLAEITKLAELPGAPSLVCQLATVPQPTTAGGVTFTPKVEQPARAFYPVTIRGEITNDELAIYADYDPGAIDDHQAGRLLVTLRERIS
jgi:amino acid adenylation domain-containing protein